MYTTIILATINNSTPLDFIVACLEEIVRRQLSPDDVIAFLVNEFSLLPEGKDHDDYTEDELLIEEYQSDPPTPAFEQFDGEFSGRDMEMIEMVLNFTKRTHADLDFCQLMFTWDNEGLVINWYDPGTYYSPSSSDTITPETV